MAEPNKDGWVELGQQLLQGKKIDEITLKGKKFKLSYSEEEFREVATKSNWPSWVIDLALYGGEHKGDGWSAPLVFPKYTPVQSEFICNFTDKFCLNSGGYGSGKSLALQIKLILLAKCFPGNRILLGRKNLSDIDRTVLPDLFELMPKSWYEHRVKDGVINFTNGSQIVLFALDHMQSGGAADIKKAQQKLRSLNIGAYFIDQLEEIDYDVFATLNSRLRRDNVPFRQGNMTTNPANFWGYYVFVGKKRKNDNGEWIPDQHISSSLIESSMLHNPHLPGDYILDQLSRDRDYVQRFVRGEWSTDVLVKGSVFAKEYLRKLETYVRPALEVREGCYIYEAPKPNEIYQIGVDPSEGVVDPSSISVVSGSGRKVAKFNGYVTIPELADKIKFLYYHYGKPLIIPEVNKSSIIEHIKDLRIYYRKQEGYKDNKPTEKLGFMTSWSSKQALITNFQEMLRAGFPKIYDRGTIDEMYTFVWTNEATHQGAAASPGAHDDDVMSTLLAFHGLTPKKVDDIIVAKTKKPEKRSFQYR